MDRSEWQVEDWLREYRVGDVLDLEEFLASHGGHGLLVCDDGALHLMPETADQIRHRCGGRARVEYTGESSPHFMRGDEALHFRVTPLGTGQGSEPFDLVVHVY